MVIIHCPVSFLPHFLHQTFINVSNSESSVGVNLSEFPLSHSVLFFLVLYLNKIFSIVLKSTEIYIFNRKASDINKSRLAKPLWAISCDLKLVWFGKLVTSFWLKCNYTLTFFRRLPWNVAKEDYKNSAICYHEFRRQLKCVWIEKFYLC